jgi:hypothetical protein
MGQQDELSDNIRRNLEIVFEWNIRPVRFPANSQAGYRADIFMGRLQHGQSHVKGFSGKVGSGPLFNLIGSLSGPDRPQISIEVNLTRFEPGAVFICELDLMRVLF